MASWARSTPDTETFIEKLNEARVGRFQITTDGFGAYPEAIHYSLGTRVDFAQLIKVYAAPAENEPRYSPARVVEVISKPVWGQPHPARICTSHIERQNLTMRMSIRRLTRLTNAVSKKRENLKAAIALHFGWYNFCRRHQTLRVTPAMEAGIAHTSGRLANSWGPKMKCEGCNTEQEDVLILRSAPDKFILERFSKPQPGSKLVCRKCLSQVLNDWALAQLNHKPEPSTQN